MIPSFTVACTVGKSFVASTIPFANDSSTVLTDIAAGAVTCTIILLTTDLIDLSAALTSVSICAFSASEEAKPSRVTTPSLTEVVIP
ncbi:hypothetical protein D3C86_1429580 [compost metagenome]